MRVASPVAFSRASAVPGSAIHCRMRWSHCLPAACSVMAAG